MSEKKNYVLDTSVYLTDANSIFKFGENDVYIPLKVLEEIDKHKTRQDSVGSNARHLIRTLDNLRERGNLEEGVPLNEEKNSGTLRVISYACLQKVVFPADLDMRIPDHIIIATAMAVRGKSKNKTIIVSRDINMRVICDSIGLKAQDYISEEVVNSSDELYTGFIIHAVDEQIIDQFYDGEDIFIDKEEIDEIWFPNQYIMLVSNSNEKKSALAKFENHLKPLGKVLHKQIPDWNISARNKEQAFAIDMLMDPNIKIVSLIGGDE